MPKRPRQIDVAKLAGVSPATVSVILNNRLDSNVRVSEETRARVLDAIEQLGYVTDPVARSLAGGRNSLLGVYTVKPIFALPQRDDYSSYLTGIEQEAEQLGYDLLFFTGQGSVNGRRQIYQGNVNRLQMADGAILLDTGENNAGGNNAKENNVKENNAELDRLVADQYPFVVIGRRELANGVPSYVAADYAAATARIVHEMLAKGHRRIAYWGAQQGDESHHDRYAGYLMAHRQLGLMQLVQPLQRLVSTQITAESIRQALTEGVTAFVMENASDLIASFFHSLAQLDKRAPDDLSLAILGDCATNFVAPYPVTYFAIPREQMGQRAVQLLVTLLRASNTPRDLQPTHQDVIPCIHISGETIGPPVIW